MFISDSKLIFYQFCNAFAVRGVLLLKLYQSLRQCKIRTHCISGGFESLDIVLRQRRTNDTRPR